MELSKSYLKAIKTIKSKGFGYIKVELEAELDRGSGITRSCQSCDESGYISCEQCDMTGYYEHEGQEIECSQCSGEGETPCGECGERGHYGADWDIDDVANWLDDYLSPKVKAAFTHFHVYDDSSVDTEATFTLPAEKAHYTLDVIEAFNALSREIGNGIDISNAGMHISVLPTPFYPCDDALSPRLINNFKREVTKLLPALFFNASHCAETRPLEYRWPKIATDDKYSAVLTHGDTCIEYRVFDPCFSKPDAFFDKIEVIAGTLKYYSTTEKVNLKAKEFGFPDSSSIPDMLRDLTNYDALHETIKHLKPANKSIRALKFERGATITKKILASQLTSQRKEAKIRYERYLRQFAENLAYQVNDLIEHEQLRAKNGMVTNLPTEYLYPKLQPTKIRKWLAENVDWYQEKPEPFKRWSQHYLNQSHYSTRLQLQN